MVSHWILTDSKSQGLFSVFWPISIMQLFGWCPFVLLFSRPLVLVSILWWLYQEHHSYNRYFHVIQFFHFLSKVQVLILFLLSFNFVLWSAGTTKSTILQTLLFLFIFIMYYLLIRVFHINVSWWSFTGVWVTASLLKSPGLFSVF